MRKVFLPGFQGRQVVITFNAVNRPPLVGVLTRVNVVMRGDRVLRSAITVVRRDGTVVVDLQMDGVVSVAFDPEPGFPVRDGFAWTGVGAELRLFSDQPDRNRSGS